MPLTFAPLYCMQWSCQQIEAHKSYTLNVGPSASSITARTARAIFRRLKTLPWPT